MSTDNMKTIEVTDDVYDLVTAYKPKTPSDVIRWWHDEVFDGRRSTISDSDFGR